MRSCRSKRRALTLLEVVVGLALMASVLVGSLLAFSSHQRQRRLADRKLVAIAAADDLLAELTASREGVPLTGRGVLRGDPALQWRTRVVGRAAPAGIPVHVIRLEVVDIAADTGVQALATVDVVKGAEE